MTFFRPEIVKLLPTLHGLMFALDISLDKEDGCPTLGVMRQELDILLKVECFWCNPVITCRMGNYMKYTLHRKSHLCIPFLGIARPPSQFPHLCVCELFIFFPRIVPHI